MVATTAERFGQRPSDLLAIPPEREWLRYCLDEALHVLAAGHSARDLKWADRFRDDPATDGGAEDLYAKHTRSGKLGKPPSRAEMELLQNLQTGGDAL